MDSCCGGGIRTRDLELMELKALCKNVYHIICFLTEQDNGLKGKTPYRAEYRDILPPRTHLRYGQCRLVPSECDIS